jgi:hypothetical protein
MPADFATIQNALIVNNEEDDTQQQIGAGEAAYDGDGNRAVVLHEDTRDPEATDDSSTNYRVGTYWYNLSSGAVYQCAANAPGNAVWSALNGSGSGPSNLSLLADFYNTTPGAISTGGIATVPLDTPRRTTSNYTINPDGSVTIAVSADVFVFFSVGLHLESGSSRTEAEVWLTRNGSEVLGTRRPTYHRTQAQGGGSAAGGCVLSLAPGDSIRIDYQRSSGSGPVVLPTEHASLVFLPVQGQRGEQGPEGPAGTDGSDGLDGQDGINGDQWTDGTGAPTDATSLTYDLYYLDKNNGDVYKKLQGNTTWLFVTNIKGPEGGGGGISGINLREDGTLVNNTPHQTINFSDQFGVSDDGNGQATVQLVTSSGAALRQSAIYNSTDTDFGGSGPYTATLNVLQFNTAAINLVSNEIIMQIGGWFRISIDFSAVLASGNNHGWEVWLTRNGIEVAGTRRAVTLGRDEGASVHFQAILALATLDTVAVRFVKIVGGGGTLRQSADGTHIIIEEL